MTKIEKPFKRIALSLSLILVMIWVMLGTSTTIAWFKDTSNQIRNIFHYANFDLLVEYKEDDTYHKLETDTAIIDDEDLYEPGFTKVQYMRVTNNGDIDFDFTIALNAFSYTLGVNKNGEEFNLKDYIKYGFVYADTEAELDTMVANRELAVEKAVTPLGEYTSDSMALAAGNTKYMALILLMPEEVGNEANYSTVQPSINFGIVVTATQQHD